MYLCRPLYSQEMLTVYITCPIQSKPLRGFMKAELYALPLASLWFLYKIQYYLTIARKPCMIRIMLSSVERHLSSTILLSNAGHWTEHTSGELYERSRGYKISADANSEVSSVILYWARTKLSLVFDNAVSDVSCSDLMRKCNASIFWFSSCKFLR